MFSGFAIQPKLFGLLNFSTREVVLGKSKFSVIFRNIFTIPLLFFLLKKQRTLNSARFFRTCQTCTQRFKYKNSCVFVSGGFSAGKSATANKQRLLIKHKTAIIFIQCWQLVYCSFLFSALNLFVLFYKLNVFFFS